MSQNKKTTALIILDGWGHREDQESNAIAHANTPVLDDLCRHYANTLISGSGLDVGLPSGQMGNSEVGHVILSSKARHGLIFLKNQMHNNKLFLYA